MCFIGNHAIWRKISLPSSNGCFLSSQFYSFRLASTPSVICSRWLFCSLHSLLLFMSGIFTPRAVARIYAAICNGGAVWGTGKGHENGGSQRNPSRHPSRHASRHQFVSTDALDNLAEKLRRAPVKGGRFMPGSV
jgi:hypothetical protein